MGFKIPAVLETLAALGTCEWFFATVDSKMVSQMLFCFETLATLGTCEWFDFGHVAFGHKFGMSTNLVYVNACVGRSRDQIMPVKNLVPIDKSNGGVTLLGVDPGISMKTKIPVATMTDAGAAEGAASLPNCI